MLYYAVWVYSNAEASTQSFWRVTGEQSDVRLNAVVEETNKIVGPDLELQTMEWEAARKQTDEAIRGHRMYDPYPSSRRKVTDEIMVEYAKAAHRQMAPR